MEENKDISTIDLLISKYLSGNATGSEILEFLDWMNASPDNCTYFAQYKIIWLKSIEQNPISKELRWEQLQSRLKEREISRFEKEEIIDESKEKTFRILRYAASIIVLLTITSVLFFVAKTKKNINLAQNVIEVPYGSKTSLILPDGTKLWINSGTKLTYNSDYGRTNRNIYLVGEAYFDVAKNRKLPFIVHTSNLKIKAVGTAFNVKAYPEEKKVETTLVHGLVEIEKEDSKTPIYLRPSQKIVIADKKTTQTESQATSKNEITNQNLKSDKTDLEVDKEVDTEKETSWKDGKLIFDREPLISLAVKLERRYDVHISFENEKLKDYKYTGTFNDLSLEQILDAIRFSSPINFEIKEKNVQLIEKD